MKLWFFTGAVALWLSGLLLVASLVWTAGCSRLLLPPPRPVTLDELARITGLSFPKTAAIRRSVMIRESRFHEVWDEVEMPLADLPSFLADPVPGSRSQVEIETDHEFSRAAVINCPSWWPVSLRGAGAGHQDIGSDNWLDFIAVVDETQELAIVHVYWTSA